jgi:hypothetical protein
MAHARQAEVTARRPLHQRKARREPQHGGMKAMVDEELKKAKPQG